jgi:hypothetical protein
MGNRSSSLATQGRRLSPQDRKKMRDQRIQENKSVVRHVTQGGGGSGDPVLWQAIQHQVDRGDLALTKNDLVAIVMRLRPEMKSSPLAVREALTVRDLIVLIRESLYVTPLSLGAGAPTTLLESKKDPKEPLRIGI